MKCKVDGCERDADYKAAQLCQKHYFRLWRYGTTDTLKRGKAKPRIVTPNGYVRVYDPAHPLAQAGYVFEHRKVAYDTRGGVIETCERCRTVSVSWETSHVDHVDEDRQNNAPENLLVTCVGCNVMRTRRKQRGCLLTFQGETKNVLQWSRDPRVKVSNSAIRHRKQMGASDEQALFGEKVTHRDTIPKVAPLKFRDGKRVSA